AESSWLAAGATNKLDGKAGDHTDGGRWTATGCRRRRLKASASLAALVMWRSKTVLVARAAAIARIFLVINGLRPFQIVTAASAVHHWRRPGGRLSEAGSGE